MNKQAEVIGINSAGISIPLLGKIGTGVSFAIPINIAKEVIPALKSGRQITKPPFIVDIYPTQISAYEENDLIISGSNIHEQAKIIIGDINLGVGTTLDNKTIVIEIASNTFDPGIYDVQIVNPRGETDILHDALTVTGR